MAVFFFESKHCASFSLNMKKRIDKVTRDRFVIVSEHRLRSDLWIKSSGMFSLLPSFHRCDIFEKEK
jgi:hypothetical protein